MDADLGRAAAAGPAVRARILRTAAPRGRVEAEPRVAAAGAVRRAVSPEGGDGRVVVAALVLPEGADTPSVARTTVGVLAEEDLRKAGPQQKQRHGHG